MKFWGMHIDEILQQHRWQIDEILKQHQWKERTPTVPRSIIVVIIIRSLPAGSPPAIERWPQGSVLCTLGESRREKQKWREEEEEKKTEP